MELINFADNEGIIGASVSVKLLQDFESFHRAAEQHEDGYFTEKYNAFMKAFELASDNGAVEFH